MQFSTTVHLCCLLCCVAARLLLVAEVESRIGLLPFTFYLLGACWFATGCFASVPGRRLVGWTISGQDCERSWPPVVLNNHGIMSGFERLVHTYVRVPVDARLYDKRTSTV